MEFLDSLFDKLEFKYELKTWNKLIKKACKKQLIQRWKIVGGDKKVNILDMYTGIHKDLLDKVNNPQRTQYNKKKKTYFFTIINQRLYDLNREFVLLINGEFHNSLYALTRQMVELYIILLYCRYDNTKSIRLLEEEKQKERITNIINSIKSKITIPYIKDVNSDKFIDSALNWFYYFSNLYHISGFSLSQNMWVYSKDNPYPKLFFEKPKLDEGDKLLVFSKKSPVSNKQYEILIHQFYTFLGLCLSEIKLLEGESNEPTDKTN